MPGFGSLFPALEETNFLRPLFGARKTAQDVGTKFGSMAPGAEPDEAQTRQTADLPGDAPPPPKKPSGFSYPPDIGAIMPEASIDPNKPPPDPLFNIAKKSTYDLAKGMIDTAASTPYGLRREDVTDIPGSAQPIDPLVAQSANIASGMVGGPAVGPAEEGMVLGSSAVRAAKAAKAAKTVEEAAPAITPEAAQASVTAKLGDVPGAHPDEQALNVNNILHPDTPATAAPRSQTVDQIAASLQARGQAALKNLGIESGTINESHPIHDELVARQMASEVEAALNRGGKTAQDWYTKSIDDAIDHANDIWPGLKDDPHQRLGFTAALAITSQGENVQNNVRLAEQAYQMFRDTGRFPTNMKVNKPKYINGNFQKMNDLLDTMTPEQLHDFMHSDFKVKELEDMGHPIGDENKGTTVKGSAILGSKIGGGFFQNLNGNYNPVTMDMWFMRALGRLQGTLVGRPPAVPKAMARFTTALKDEGIRVPRDPQKLSDLADQKVLEWEREFRTNRAQYDSGAKTKPELAKAAERYQANLSGINETPLSGGHRQWIRGIVNRANDILKSRGHNLTNADMQAIWWYPEKELYSKLGGVDSEALNTDYATELANLKARRAAAPVP